MMDQQYVKTETVRPDSYSFGTPATGGVWKVYVDVNDEADAERRIDAGARLFAHAKKKDEEARSGSLETEGR